MKIFSALWMVLFYPVLLFAQLQPQLARQSRNESAIREHIIQPGDLLLQGFGGKITGADYVYTFPIDGVSEAMILRATKGDPCMEWQTEPVPTVLPAKYVNVIFPVGMDCKRAVARFYLYIDNRRFFTFDTRNEDFWEISGPDSSSLAFRSILTDNSGDRRGFFFLRLPASMLQKGEPIRLKVVAENAGLQTWFMLFKSKILPDTTITQLPAIVEGKQLLRLDLIRFAPPAKATITLNGKKIREANLSFGKNTILIPVERTIKPRTVKIGILTDGQEERHKVQLHPTRPWQVNFVQHVHTDIGYTRPQTEILGEHIRYIDYALDYCDLTDNYPDDARFRWTCESSWAVEQYLRTRPASQIERLKRRIREGRIELTGMLFNFSELPDEQSLAASLEPIRTFHTADLPVETAMQNDVNGIAWCMADYLPEAGIRYLSMGTHGHRALTCFDYPTLFRWQSPSGNEMIAYRADHYHTGNFLGIEKGDFEQFEQKLLDYLSQLEAKGYPYDITAIQFSGYLTDNAPPSTAACEMIRRWNEKYDYPKLRSAVSAEFFRAAEARYIEQMPVLRKAWPDWWTDGFGAAARETAVSRLTHADLTATRTALAMARLLGEEVPASCEEELAAANNALLFYDEHTVGYSESVRDPYCKPSMEQRALKESYPWEAYRRTRIAGEGVQGLLQAHAGKSEVPSLIVYNPLNWERSGLVEVYIDHQLLPPGKPFRITDTDGREIAVQPVRSRSDGTYWHIWAERVPALGAARSLIRTGEGLPSTAKATDTLPDMVENSWYRLRFNPDKASITELTDKELGVNLIDTAAEWQLGQLIHERLAERQSMENYRMGEYSRQLPENIRFSGMYPGTVYDTYRFTGHSDSGIGDGDNFTFELRLFKKVKRIELAYSLIKKPDTDPEALYVAFPFALPDSRIYFELQGGAIEAGKEQIPGSSNDWNTVQHFAAVRNETNQIILGSPEVPLMQFGAINTGRYRAGALPASSHIYSWVMNNYWTTNFNADQRGAFEWSYYLTSEAGSDNGSATRFGWGSRVPMLCRALPPAGDGATAEPLSAPPLQIEGENLLLVGMQPAPEPNAVLLHLRETAGKKVPLRITSPLHPDLTIEKCNVLGEPVGPIGTIEPRQSVFIRVSWP